MVKKCIALFVSSMFALSLGIAYADEDMMYPVPPNSPKSTASKKGDKVKKKGNKTAKKAAKKTDKKMPEKPKEASSKKSWKFWE